jgi:hypothetical protein
MRKIKIHSELKKQIAAELKTSLQTVHTALCYFNNSAMAVEIRKRAKILLLKEANKIEEIPTNE